ncbi:MAG: Flp pilus assembly protein CpaB [Paracoccaceae bacterium]
MRLVFGLVLVLGMALAGFAVFLARGYIGEYQAELAIEREARSQMIETVNVFVSTRSLKYGERLRDVDVREVRWPVESLPEGVFHQMDALFPKGVAENDLRTVIRAMEKGEAVLAIKITGPGEDAGVSSRLGKGMRAFALKVDVSSGVSGFLRPGDRVDVYWTGKNYSSDNEGRGGDITQLIETAVKLLAIDQIADQDRNSARIARTVTVEATPQQVAALAQAQATGKLALSLVGAEEDSVAEAVSINGRDLLGIQERQVVAAQVQRVCTVKTRKGAEIIEMPIQCAAEN